MENLQNQNQQEIKKVTETFKTYLQQLGYSKSTVQMLPACVFEFLKYSNITQVEHINQAHIQSFYEYLQQRQHKRKSTHLSETFITHNIYSIKVFLNYLEQTGQIQYNPISNLQFERPKPHQREPLSRQHIEQLFASAVTPKERAILHLFYSCGLRRTEAENLNISDIHFSKNIVYVREGKGKKRRAIPINETVKKELESYVNNDRLTIKHCTCKEAFMLNERGDKMKGSQYNQTLKKLVSHTDLPSTISLHHLRHSIATHLLENGLSIEYVRDFLGHNYLEATQIYAKVHYRMLNF